MQADCTFCQIVSGELPADLVDEDERTVAFMDINPATLGHVLVVPRRHVADLMSADAADWLAVAATARRMARWVVGAFNAGGVDLMQANSNGSVGNQTVFHLHVHVLPRYHDDQLGSWWSPQTADPAEITEAARRLVEHGRRDPETAPEPAPPGADPGRAVNRGRGGGTPPGRRRSAPRRAPPATPAAWR